MRSSRKHKGSIYEHVNKPNQDLDDLPIVEAKRAGKVIERGSPIIRMKTWKVEKIEYFRKPIPRRNIKKEQVIVPHIPTAVEKIQKIIKKDPTLKPFVEHTPLVVRL